MVGISRWGTSTTPTVSSSAAGLSLGSMSASTSVGSSRSLLLHRLWSLRIPCHCPLPLLRVPAVLGERVSVRAIRLGCLSLVLPFLLVCGLVLGRGSLLIFSGCLLLPYVSSVFCQGSMPFSILRAERSSGLLAQLHTPGMAKLSKPGKGR